MDFISDPLHLNIVYKITELQELHKQWSDYWEWYRIVCCAVTECACGSLCSWMRPFIPLSASCLSIVPLSQNCLKQRGKGGFSCSQPGRKEETGRQREQERKSVVSKPTRGLWQWRERVCLPSSHWGEGRERKQEKLDNKGWYGEKGRKRKWENAAQQASQGKEKTGN